MKSSLQSMAAALCVLASVTCARAALAQDAPEHTVVAQAVIAQVASPQPTATPAMTVAPAPAPTPMSHPTAAPRGFSYRGYVRAYDFTRDNTSSNLQNKASTAVDQRSFNTALGLHAEDAFFHGLSVGGSYLYAYPFDGHCSLVSDHYPGSPCVTQQMPGLRPDDTLPGYELNALYEAYLAYADENVGLKIGDQLYNTPWANASDSRLKPAAFQGADLTYRIDQQFNVEVSAMTRFQNRDSDTFDRSTLLTSFSPVPSLGGSFSVPANIYDPTDSTIQTSGFEYARIGYAYGPGNRFTASVSGYDFNDIADAGWAEARYQIYPPSRFKPFIALQGGIEKNVGQAIIGKVDSAVAGGQIGLMLTPRVQVTAGYDSIPVRVDKEVSLAGTGLSCSSTGHTIGLQSGIPSATASLPYFLPSGGTANCTANADGTADIYYGGWASPYTFSYATDPLFTTSLTQGLVDRGSPGNAYKTQLTYTTIDRRVVASVSYGNYRYTNPGYAQITGEVDADLWLHLERPNNAGTYKGPSLRYRFGDRYQSGTSAYGGTPDFRYNRLQFEFDF